MLRISSVEKARTEGVETRNVCQSSSLIFSSLYPHLVGHGGRNRPGAINPRASPGAETQAKRAAARMAIIFVGF
jgi:hypothetical protein